RFISSLVGIHGQHPSSFHRWRYLLSTAQACKFLRLPHHIHSPYEKSITIERTMQYMIKDRTECFDDYFPCRKNDTYSDRGISRIRASFGPKGRY
ncbi:MAG: hypothetical protein WBZ20_06765, partial [Nitrososphaeraceae archaeon]